MKFKKVGLQLLFFLVFYWIVAGVGSVAGSAGSKVIDVLSPITDQVTKDVVGAVTGSAASALTGNAVKSELDKRDKK